MTDRPIFDHVAIAVQRWSDGYAWFVQRFGGKWLRGGNAGAFSPAQFGYLGDMKVELLQPGDEPENFVERFLGRAGPGAHHLTFHVPDMDDFHRGCTALGLPMVPAFLDLPGRRELFVHPKTTGFGTLLQAIECGDDYAGTSPGPDDLPKSGEPHEVCWVALRVPDMALAHSVFAGVLGGGVRDQGHVDGAAWALLEWPNSRRLLVYDSGMPAPSDVLTAAAGVEHVLFAPVGGPLPDPVTTLLCDHWTIDPLIGLSVLEVSGARD